MKIPVGSILSVWSLLVSRCLTIVDEGEGVGDGGRSTLLFIGVWRFFTSPWAWPAFSRRSHASQVPARLGVGMLIPEREQKALQTTKRSGPCPYESYVSQARYFTLRLVPADTVYYSGLP